MAAIDDIQDLAQDVFYTINGAENDALFELSIFGLKSMKQRRTGTLLASMILFWPLLPTQPPLRSLLRLPIERLFLTKISI
jgi:hypothetical protein